MAANLFFKFREASCEDLSTKQGIIYLIQNRYNYKSYLGKTINTFNNRYSGDWSKHTVNTPLLRALNHQSKEGFKIFILEYNILYNDVLRRHEAYWADLLNTYAPNGYNLRECGEGGEYYGEGKIIKQKACEKLRKTYQLKRISDGHIFTITHLDEWCKEMGVRSGRIRNVLCGLVKKSQGFSLLETDLKQRPPNCLTYKVRCISSGEIITIVHLSSFCKENNLNTSLFRCMLCGAQKTSQGYELVSRPEKIRKQTYTSKFKNTIVLDRNNIEYTLGDSLRDFCERHNLLESSFRYLIRGSWSEYKGWRVKTPCNSKTSGISI